MAWAGFIKNHTVPKEAIEAMLDLLDRIQYAYLKVDGTYGDLHPIVSGKVKYIEKLLYKEMEKESKNENRNG